MFGDFFSRQKKKRSEMKESLIKISYQRTEEKDKRRLASIQPAVRRAIPLHMTEHIHTPEIPNNQLLHLPFHPSYMPPPPVPSTDSYPVELHSSIHRLHIVYKYAYANGEKVTGLGDFIRGCYFFLQFAEIHGIHVDFHIANHPLRDFLEYFAEKPFLEENILKKIPYFTQNEFRVIIQSTQEITYEYVDNYQMIIKNINSLNRYPNGNVFFYAVNHPDENTIYSMHIKRVRDMFRPTSTVSIMVDNTLHDLTLEKNTYIVIHIRLEDSGTPSTNIQQYSKYIMDKIHDIQKNGQNVLLISNNPEIKKIILNYFPQIKTIFHEIIHIGEVSNESSMFLINTLKEFYLMSYANFIYSFSVYPHGSGFSKWCAKTYDIPYVCYHLHK